jgi:hypothetical protein
MLATKWDIITHKTLKNYQKNLQTIEKREGMENKKQ